MGTESTFLFIHQSTALAKHATQVIYNIIAALINFQICGCMASDELSNQTSFTVFNMTHCNAYCLSCFCKKQTNMLTFIVTIGGEGGGALYLLAGIVSAESHLGHLHFEIICPLSRAFREQYNVNSKSQTNVSLWQNIQWSNSP